MSAALAEAPVRLDRLRAFTDALAALIDETDDELRIVAEGAELLRALIAHDDWLPPLYAEPDPARYAQYLLQRDADDRFSIVSFVWGPGQVTPIHDHRVWGLVGVLRGAELVESFARDADGALVSQGAPTMLRAGDVDAVSPTIGDLHRVANAFDDRVSVSIHVYGADIGRVERATYDLAGRAKPFVSGYAEAPALDLDR